MKNIPHLILETANVHGGDPNILINLIDGFSELEYPVLGMKFHPFKPDHVALEDFSYYEKMTQWFIPEGSWGEILHHTTERHFSVWLDLFCVFGVELLKNQLSLVEGIKLQPSVLDNREVFEELVQLRLNHQNIILNIAGFDIHRIRRWVDRYSQLDCRQLILQAGFQCFPTSTGDTSLGKIRLLKKEFPGVSLSYADHLAGGSRQSIQFPSYAFAMGCEFVEKHVCLDRKNTTIDGDSALEPEEIKELCNNILEVAEYFNVPFLTENEKEYAKNTLQKVVVAESLSKGQMVSRRDVLFRRTDKEGLDMNSLEERQKDFFLLKHDKKKWETVNKKDFKRAKIGVIVACRLKSSRLKKKAVLPITGVPAIERCLGNCLKISMGDEVILATSDLDEDAVLADHLVSGKVKFWIGDPDDVISRYLGACEKYDLDVIIRVTGDSPVISSEIAEYTVRSHFETGADFSKPDRCAIGTICEVYNVEALERISKLWGGRAEYSEHMTLYVTNNPRQFKINSFPLPDDMVRDYRLTLDYPEDLEMFNRLFDKLAEEKRDPSLKNIFKVLDENPEIAGINAHLQQIYQTDEALIKRLNEATTLNDT